MIAVSARITAKPGREAEVEAGLRSFVAQTRAEPGVLTYALHRLEDQPRTFFFYERHASRTSFTEHLAMPYLDAGLAKVIALLDGPPVMEVMELLEEK